SSDLSYTAGGPTRFAGLTRQRYEMEGRSDGNEAFARWLLADQRAEPSSRGVRRARHVEASVAVDPRRVYGYRLDESVDGRLRTRARRDHVRSTRARPYPGYVAGDVVRAVR